MSVYRAKMHQKFTKSSLAIVLSRLKGFSNPKVSLEQYSIDGENAADLLFKCLQLGDLNGKVIDLGTGTGILAIGAALLGARVTAVEKDPEAMKLARSNQESLESEGLCLKIDWITSNIEEFDGSAECILQNPPFGTKKAHVDCMFLEKAMKLAPVVYSLHKSETLSYLTSFIQKRGFSVTHEFKCELPLKNTMQGHRRRICRIKTIWLRLQKAQRREIEVNI